MKLAAFAAIFMSAALAAGSAFAADAGAQKFLADRHVAKGVQCASCHGPDAKNPKEPTIDTCTQCHPTKALVEKTKNVKPTNPHTSPHYQDQLECTNCHHGHEAPEVFCDQCHQFGFKVP
jgi:cytochrome c553